MALLDTERLLNEGQAGRGGEGEELQGIFPASTWNQGCPAPRGMAVLQHQKMPPCWGHVYHSSQLQGECLLQGTQ